MWGFGEPEFLGTESQYEKFIQEEKHEVAENWPSFCEPEYQIAGGLCKTDNIDKVCSGIIIISFCNYLVNSAILVTIQ